MSYFSDGEAKTHGLQEYPTPEERAEFVIMQLEKFIRDGRTVDEGMSFKKWQAMAQEEIATAIKEAERAKSDHGSFVSRLTFIASAAMVSIGFWGAAVSLENVSVFLAAAICFGAGITLLVVMGYWRFRKWNNYRKATERRWRLMRIKNINKRIKRLQTALEEEEENLKESAKERSFLTSS